MLSHKKRKKKGKNELQMINEIPFRTNFSKHKINMHSNDVNMTFKINRTIVVQQKPDAAVTDICLTWNDKYIRTFVRTDNRIFNLDYNKNSSFEQFCKMLLTAYLNLPIFAQDHPIFHHE